MNTKKEQTRRRILEAAGKDIRELGFGAAGVDTIAKDAGVTSGALYAHFGSKQNLFEASVIAGMQDFIDEVQRRQREDQDNWLSDFIDWYLSDERVLDIAHSCALPGLSTDVARASVQTRNYYQKKLMELIGHICQGLPDGSESSKSAQTMWLLSTLAGAVMLARAVTDGPVRQQICQACKDHILHHVQLASA